MRPQKQREEESIIRVVIGCRLGQGSFSGDLTKAWSGRFGMGGENVDLSRDNDILAKRNQYTVTI